MDAGKLSQRVTRNQPARPTAPGRTAVDEWNEYWRWPRGRPSSLR